MLVEEVRVGIPPGIGKTNVEMIDQKEISESNDREIGDLVSIISTPPTATANATGWALGDLDREVHLRLPSFDAELCPGSVPVDRSF